MAKRKLNRDSLKRSPIIAIDLYQLRHPVYTTRASSRGRKILVSARRDISRKTSIAHDLFFRQYNNNEMRPEFFDTSFAREPTTTAVYGILRATGRADLRSAYAGRIPPSPGGHEKKKKQREKENEQAHVVPMGAAGNSMGPLVRGRGGIFF